MDNKTFQRNWMLHYIHPEWLYLPGRGGTPKSRIIIPSIGNRYPYRIKVTFAYQGAHNSSVFSSSSFYLRNSQNEYFTSPWSSDRQVIIGEDEYEMPVYLFEQMVESLTDTLSTSPSVASGSSKSVIFCFKKKSDYEYFDYQVNAAKTVIEKSLQPRIEYMEDRITHSAAYVEYQNDGFISSTSFKDSLVGDWSQTASTIPGDASPEASSYQNTVTGQDITAICHMSYGTGLKLWINNTSDSVPYLTEYSYTAPKFKTYNNINVQNVTVNTEVNYIQRTLEIATARNSTPTIISKYQQRIQPWADARVYGAPDLPSNVGRAAANIGNSNDPDIFSEMGISHPFLVDNSGVWYTNTVQVLDKATVTVTIEGVSHVTEQQALQTGLFRNGIGSVNYHRTQVTYPSVEVATDSSPFTHNSGYNGSVQDGHWIEPADYFLGVAGNRTVATGNLVDYTASGQMGESLTVSADLTSGIETSVTKKYTPAWSVIEKTFDVEASWNGYHAFTSSTSTGSILVDDWGATGLAISDTNETVINTTTVQQTETEETWTDDISVGYKMQGLNLQAFDLVTPFSTKNPSSGIVSNAGNGVALYDGLTSQDYQQQYGEAPPFTADVAVRIYLKMQHPKEYENNE